jgi:hypothetical protein
MAKIAVSTNIEQSIFARLEAYAAKTGESKISVFERALDAWLSEKEKEA